MQSLRRGIDRVVGALAGAGTNRAATAVRVAILTLVVSVLHGSARPSTWGDRIAAIEFKSHHLFSPIPSPAGSHDEKLAFRIVGPALGAIFRFNGGGYRVMLVLLGIVFFACAYLLVRRLTDHTFATVITLGLGLGYCGQAFVADPRLHLDGVAFAITMVAMVVPALVGGVFAFLGMFSDERALLPLVFGNTLPNGETAERRRRGAVIAAGVVAAVIARQVLIAVTDLENLTGRIGWAVFADNITHTRFLFGLLGAWGGLWLLLVVGAKHLWNGSLEERAALAAIALTVLGSIAFYDVTRTATYAFPAVIAVAVALHKRDADHARTVANAALVLGIALPAINMLNALMYRWPLPYWLAT